MGAFDIFGSVMPDLGPIMWALIGGMGLFLIGAILYFTGGLDKLLKRYQTKVLCFEKRQGRIVFVGVDKAWPHRVEGELTYSLKNRKINIPPPPIEYIHLVNGENVVFIYFPDRDEGHPFAIETLNTEKLISEATEGKHIETKQELLDALKTIDAENKIMFSPVVEDSSINLVTTQLQKNAMRYQSNLDKIMKYLPIIATVVTMLVIIIGVWLIMGKIDDMQFTVTCVSGATAPVTSNVPFVPEMP